MLKGTALKNNHCPVEIFGYPIDSSSSEANKVRSKHWCPFMDKKCNKRSQGVSYPMGICSVSHMGHLIPICPNRFLQDNIAFTDVCEEFFGSINNILLFSEVRLKSVGAFDFVLVKHKPLSDKVDDFCIVEFQSDSTTGTGQLVKALKDFVAGMDISSVNYKYGMNTYNTIKLAYTQMLYKGQALEKWGKRIIWVCPEYIFDNTVKRFSLSNLEYKSENSTAFFIYELKRESNTYKLQLSAKKSSTVGNLLTAYTEQPTPKIDNFIAVLENKLKLKLGMKLS